MAQALRTPDERFADLPGYSFAGHYIDDLEGCSGLRVHYLDEGPADAQRVFFCACMASRPGATCTAA